MPHHSTKFYTIEIESLHAELIASSVENLTCFLDILNQTGNDKMNSLFEFQTDAAEAFKQTNSIRSFIRAKYLHKLFFNANEIDYNDNYLERLNKILHVKGLCIPIIIYNLFLGANINYFQINSNKTVLDVASSASGDELSCQVYYLKLNNALRFEEIVSQLGAASEFEGEITQIYDMNPTITSPALISSLPNGPISIKIGKQCLRLIQGDQSNHQLVKFRKKPLEIQINHSSIIKILNHVNKSLIEIKWCDMANNSLVSTYLQYSCCFEKQIWMKQFCLKLLKTFNEVAALNLGNLIDYCQIDLFGFLSLSIYNDADEQVLVILIQSEETQVNYFNKLLVVIEKTCHNVIDLRKISLKCDDTSIRIDHQNKLFVFKSTGYSQNLKNWYEQLLNASQMKFNSIEDQYLSKENVPLLIEKCCSFVELHLMTEKSFYNDSALKVNQKLKHLTTRLLSEKKFEFEENISSASILYFLKHFFTAYIRDKHLTIFVRKLPTLFDLNAEKISQSRLNKLDDLKVLLDKQIHRNSVFYHAIKRVCIHLNLITHYTYRNDMNINYLVDLFVTFMFDLNGYIAKNYSFLLDNFSLSHEKFSHKELYKILRVLLSKVLSSMIENCQYLFNLKENFLTIQIEMIERSFDLKNINKPQLADLKHEQNAIIQNFLLTIYLNDKKSGRSFQLNNVDYSFTCGQALACAKQEFKLEDSKYLSLFEVHDSDQSCLLERPLSVNAVLINELSSWSSFYLCVKYNMLEMQVDNLDLLNIYEECEFLVYCDNSLMHKRWKTGYLSIQNNMLRVFKRNYSKSVEFRNSSSSNIQIEMHTLQSKSNKQLSEMKLEELVCYLGVYSTDLLKNNCAEPNRSISMSMSSLANEIQINDQECLTLFDRKNKFTYCIHFQSRSRAFEWYKHLFSFVYEPNSWKFFDSDSLPHLARIEPIYFNIVTDLNQSNSTTLTKIFKKIIHK